MKEYLFLFRGGDGLTLKQSPDKWQEHMERWMSWMRQLGEQGKFVGAQPLTSEGKQVKGSKKIVTDGPYIEDKEMVGGYLICTADSFEEALDLSMGCPILEFESGIVEVREINQLKM